MFTIRITAAISPTHISAISMWLLLESHSSVGAYQNRAAPRLRASPRYSPAGRIPCVPISPFTWNSSA